MKKRTCSTSLGDLEKTTNLLSLCLALQGNPSAGSGPVTKEQRRTSSLALRCFDRAQAQTAKSVNGSPKPKVDVEETASEEDGDV